MSLVALMLLPLLAGSAFAYPTGIDASLGLDANVGLGGGLGLGVGGLGLGAGLDASLGVGLDAGAGTGGYGIGYNGGQGLRAWPYDNYGPLTQNSILDYANPLAYSAEAYATPYVYDDYPRTVDYARENYIRRYPVVASEVGIRDQFSVRPSYVSAPYSRYYSTYFPYNYYGGGIGCRNAFF